MQHKIVMPENASGRYGNCDIVQAFAEINAEDMLAIRTQIALPEAGTYDIGKSSRRIED
jgi:hypothetical protein